MLYSVETVKNAHDLALWNEMKDIYCKWKKAYSVIKQIQKGDMDLLQSKANPFPPKVQWSGDLIFVHAHPVQASHSIWYILKYSESQ